MPKVFRFVLFVVVLIVLVVGGWSFIRGRNPSVKRSAGSVGAVSGPGLEMKKYEEALETVTTKLGDPVLGEVSIIDYRLAGPYPDDRLLIDYCFVGRSDNQRWAEAEYTVYEGVWETSRTATSSCAGGPIGSSWMISYEQALEAGLKSLGATKSQLCGDFQIASLSQNPKYGLTWQLYPCVASASDDVSVRVDALTGEVQYSNK